MRDGFQLEILKRRDKIRCLDCIRLGVPGRQIDVNRGARWALGTSGLLLSIQLRTHSSAATVIFFLSYHHYLLVVRGVDNNEGQVRKSLVNGVRIKLTEEYSTGRNRFH